MDRSKRLALFFTLLTCAGCVSVETQVSTAIKSANFEKAHNALIKYYDETLPGGFPAELIDLKNQYTKSLEESAKIELQVNKTQGDLDSTNKLIRDFLSICPWSNHFKIELESNIEEKRKTKLFIFELKNAEKNQDASALIKLFIENSKLYKFSLNTESLKNETKSSISSLLELVSENYKKGNYNTAVLLDILEEIIPDKEEHMNIANLAIISNRAYSSADLRLINLTTNSIKEQLSATSHKVDGIILTPITKTLKENYLSHLGTQLTSYQDTLYPYEYVNFLESWTDKLTEILPYLTDDLYKIHRELYSTHINEIGLRKIIPLVHLLRSLQLKENPSLNPQYKRTLDSIESEFSGIRPVDIDIVFDSNPEVDPPVQAIMELILFSELRDIIKPYININMLDYHSSGDAKIYFDNVEWVFPVEDQLSKKNSLYFSHMESIPNPAISTLEFQISMAKISVDSAERWLDSAIFSHNLYPTDYSLINVNSARNRYISALNQHNSLVSRYNAAPATISKRVNMPYQFLEGLFSHGVNGSVSFNFDNERTSTMFSEIENCFVRIGTRLGDTDPNNRRDVSCNRDFDFESFYEKLVRSQKNVLENDFILQIAELVKSKVGNIPANYSNVLLHTLFNCSIPETFEMQPWQKKAISEYKLPLIDNTAPSIVVEKVDPIISSNFNTENDYLESISSSTCQILCGNSSGSGFLISESGVIATSAHVIKGKKIQVNFSTDNKIITYSAEVISTNEDTDIALVKAINFKESIKPLVLSAMPNHPINSSLVISGFSGLNGSSQEFGKPIVVNGFLSKSSHDFEYSSFHIIDATISSGNSGGPIISKVTGEVIGVVHAILNPEYSSSFASSGARVLASPSSKFFEVLNFSYSD